MVNVKLDMEQGDARDNIRQYGWNTPEHVGRLQIVVYVMAGGGHVGRLAAERPKDFYMDSRLRSRPYPKDAIMQAVAVLAACAEEAGMDPCHLPPQPAWHNCGVF